VTSNYSAEYGRTSGGVINAITRSGTNDLHGNAYEFLRNSALDARNFFDGPQIPEFRRNQFGASGGAPIKKDKAFIFVDYEGLRQDLGVTEQAKVPSPNARTGIIQNANGTTTTLTVNPQIAPYLSIYALPNAGLLGVGNTGIYSFVSQQIASENYVTTRFDYDFSQKDSFFATYEHDSSFVTLPDALNVVSTQQATANQHIAIEENHVFNPRFINAVRVGYNRVHDIGGGGYAAVNPAAANLSLGSIPGEDVGIVSVSGLTKLAGGVNDSSLVAFGWNSFQEYDDANLTLGKHSIKFGGNAERDQDNRLSQTNLGGVFAFGSLNSLLTDQPTSFSTYFAPPAFVAIRQTVLGAYVQDDWRWRPNVTLNLGLRYEMSRVPTEAANRFLNLPTPTSTALQSGTLFANPTLRNFEPRIGFAWDPFGDGKTSVRSGFGMFDVLPLPYEYHIDITGPLVKSGQITSHLPANTFPSGAYQLLLNAPLPLAHVIYIDPHPKRNYVMQWNLSIQREVTPGLTIMAAYLGSRGVHNNFVADDLNMVLPTLTPAGYLWPKPGTGVPVNPNFGRIDIVNWNDNSFYDALEAQVTKRMSHGLQVQGSYTWSKSIDEGSGTGVGDPYANSISNLFFFENQSNRSLSDFNVKHNGVINTTWTAPNPNFSNQAANRVLGGWELGAIIQARTGLPFTVLIGGDPLGTQDSSPVDFPNRLTTPGCQSAVNPGNVNYLNLSCFSLPVPTAAIAAQCTAFATVPGTCENLQGNAQRNSLIGPGLVDLDFSVFKNNYFGRSERFNAQFRMEFFNILNHPNFNSPTDNETVFNADGSPTGGAGLIDSTSTTSRQIQFALKLIW